MRSRSNASTLLAVSGFLNVALLGAIFLRSDAAPPPKTAPVETRPAPQTPLSATTNTPVETSPPPAETAGSTKGEPDLKH